MDFIGLTSYSSNTLSNRGNINITPPVSVRFNSVRLLLDLALEVLDRSVRLAMRGC